MSSSKVRFPVQGLAPGSPRTHEASLTTSEQAAQPGTALPAAPASRELSRGAAEGFRPSTAVEAPFRSHTPAPPPPGGVGSSLGLSSVSCVSAHSQGWGAKADPPEAHPPGTIPSLANHSVITSAVTVSHVNASKSLLPPRHSDHGIRADSHPFLAGFVGDRAESGQQVSRASCFACWLRWLYLSFPWSPSRRVIGPF